MVAATKMPPNTVENDLYTCVIDQEEKTISITTDLGPEVARRVAEFEAGRSEIGISLIFAVEHEPDSRVYLFRLRYGGCLPDEGTSLTGEDQYKDLAQQKGRVGPGCPHSRKGDSSKCSLCIAAREKAELIALIKAGKL